LSAAIIIQDQSESQHSYIQVKYLQQINERRMEKEFIPII